MVLDENGVEVPMEYWDYMLTLNQTASNGERVTTALALRIASDVMAHKMQLIERLNWNPRDIHLAMGVISAIRAQQGVMGPDAEALDEPDGIPATRQIDIWVFG